MSLLEIGAWRAADGGRRPFDLIERQPLDTTETLQQKGVNLTYHEEGVAYLATALNNADRSIVGDPRRGSYAVSLKTKDMDEARQFAKHMASLGLEPRTNVRRDEQGQPILAFVTLYDADDQRRLFETIEGHLGPHRRQRLENLVLARGPIPDDILERIWNASELHRWSAQTIATKMNELGILAGMRGIRWTAKKVRAALAEYQQRGVQQPEATQGR